MKTLNFLASPASRLKLVLVRTAPNPTMCRLLVDVSAGIRVLQSRDGVTLSENQILERARNIVMGLVGNYRIESLESDGVANTNGVPADAATSPGEAREPLPVPLLAARARASS